MSSEPIETAEDKSLEEIRDTAQRVLADYCSGRLLHRHVGTRAPLDLGLWSSIGELGWLTVSIPESLGGSGGGLVTACTIQTCLGGVVAPIPYASTILGALTLADWPERRVAEEILPEVTRGAVVIGTGQIGLPQITSLRASRDRTSVTLRGESAGVLDAAGADLLLVQAQGPESEVALALVPARHPQVSLRPMPLADRTRTLATLVCNDVTVDTRFVLFGVPAVSAASAFAKRASLMTAADAIGGARASLAITIEYLKTRQQFGKPIGSFQALKHRVANLKTRLEMASILTATAVGSSEERPWMAHMAKATACDTYADIAAETVQLHGGIGFTWEHMAHFYLKRAKLDQALFGDSGHHRDRIAELLVRSGKHDGKH